MRRTIIAGVCALLAAGPAAAQLELLSPDLQPESQFGIAVAIDVAESGETWAVVGAPRHDDDVKENDDTGAAYVYRLEGANQWVLVQELFPLGDKQPADDRFGISVSIDEDLIAVGANFDDESGFQAGAVHLYRRIGASWFHEAKLLPDEFSDDANFGNVVDVEGDYVIVGAPAADEVGSDTGAAYVYRYDGVEWLLDDTLVGLAIDTDRDGEPDAAFSGSQFGRSVSIDVDVKTGHVRAIVGAWLDGFDLEGGAYIFDRPVDDGGKAGGGKDGKDEEGPWVSTTRSTPTGEFFDVLLSLYGFSVSIDGDRAVVGAFNEGALCDDDFCRPGAVYVYERFDEIWVQLDEIVPDDLEPLDRFGESVAIHGDVIVVGAPGDDDACIDPDCDTGAAYVYVIEAVLPQLVDKLVAPDAEPLDEFGFVVDVDECEAIVGAWNHMHGMDVVGAAYTYGLGVCVNDCNDNGIPDEIDLAVGTSDDCNANAVPDECEVDSVTCLRQLPNQTESLVSDLTAQAFRAEQFSVAMVSTVQTIRFWGGYGQSKSGPPADSFTLNVRPDDAGVPGAEVIHSIQAQPADTRVATGEVFTDASGGQLIDEYQYEFVLSSPLVLQPGVYWIDLYNLTPAGATWRWAFGQGGVPNAVDFVATRGSPAAAWVLIADPDLFLSLELDCNLVDLNLNGIPDECEDCNDNGLTDSLEIADGLAEDCNGNLLPDECDIANGAVDVNGDGIPDECQDCNNNGIADKTDISNGTSLDINDNEIPDECEEDCNDNAIPDSLELELAPSLDCNLNGVLDVCDIASGTLDDLNGNGVPDLCELDCNDNGIPDDLDIMFGIALDLNGNGIPDECEPDCNGNLFPDDFEIEFGITPDCNENGVPDDCDIASGDSQDQDGNGVPDECEAPTCPADIDGNGFVDVDDLLAVLLAWNTINRDADVTNDGAVNVDDLVAVLLAWGVCERA